MAGSELQPGMLELLGTSRSLSPPHTQLLLLFFFFFPLFGSAAEDLSCPLLLGDGAGIFSLPLLAGNGFAAVS